MKVNEIITQRFTDCLKENRIPWRKSWNAHQFRNALSQRPYSGVNVLMLSLFGKGMDYVTFKQASSLGGSVKKGANGIPICFCGQYEKEKKATDGTTRKERGLMLRYYTVFSVEDCELNGWQPPKQERLEFTPIEQAEKLLAGSGAIVSHTGNSASYFPALHQIRMPKREDFKSIEAYYVVLFHELTHWTAKELGEQLDTNFNNDKYSKEELVAEIGACFLANYCGIDLEKTMENSVAYIQGWMARLKDDAQLILSAASKAQKRFEWLLGKLNPQTIETQELVEV